MEQLGSKIAVYKIKRTTMWTMLGSIVTLLILSVLLWRFPESWHRSLKELLKDDIKRVDLLINYWYLFLAVAAFLIIWVLIANNFRRIEIYQKGILLDGLKGKKIFQYEEICKIEDGMKLKIYFYDKKKVTIPRNDCVDYIGLFHELKEMHKLSVLGENFPDNIEALSFNIGKHAAVDEGTVLYKDHTVKFSKIISFKVYQQENSYNLGIAMSIPSLKEKTIMLTPAEICNEDALHEILKIISTEDTY